MEEYGNCIKQLAAANIFPGDMPLKNFGVTRHGRVVFYDYDEIAILTTATLDAFPNRAPNRKRCRRAPGTPCGQRYFSGGVSAVFLRQYQGAKNV